MLSFVSKKKPVIKCYRLCKKKKTIGIVLITDSVLLMMEQLMSWLLAGHHATSCSPLIPATVSQSCLTLWDPVDCSLPGSSIQGILQATIM